MKALILALLAALLAGCAAGPRIDRTYAAQGQSSRVKFIVLHYTVSDTAQSLKTLTQQEVSSHYLLTDGAEPQVYGLVDEARQANHAGLSSWKNYTYLNASSIGIEIVNPGYSDTPQGRLWHPYPQAQIDVLIALLRQIVARHAIQPGNILGHSDIAPQRKIDPGPLFPWQQLAAAGLIPWPDAALVASRRAVFERQLPDPAWFQQRLALHGFALAQTGLLDAATRKVLSAFQMKYRPSSHDGVPDAQTAALLDVLVGPAAAPAPGPVCAETAARCD